MQHIKVDDITFITDSSHPLYDPRIDEPVNPDIVSSYVDEAINVEDGFCAVRTPIRVTKDGFVIDGRRRVMHSRAAQAALNQPFYVPVIFTETVSDDEDTVFEHVLLNEVREETSVVQKGRYALKLQKMGVDKTRITKAFGKTRRMVDYYLKLVKNGSDALLDAVEAGQMPVQQAVQLLGIAKTYQVPAVEYYLKRRVLVTDNALLKAAAGQADAVAYLKANAKQQAPTVTKAKLAKLAKALLLQDAYGEDEDIREVREALAKQGLTGDQFAYGILWATGQLDEWPFSDGVAEGLQQLMQMTAKKKSKKELTDD